jgi:hypothetical protein
MTKPQLLAAAILAGALCGSGACESGFERNDQIVNSLRILGARDTVIDTDQTDWADAEDGDTIELSALVANPAGLPSVTITWLACVPGTTAVSPCMDEGVLRDPTTLIDMAKDPTTSGVLLLGVGETIPYTIPSEIKPLLDAVIARADQNANAECAVYIEVPLVIIAQGGDHEVFTATKNLRLSPWMQTGPGATDPALQHYFRNANPSITQLLLPDNPSVCTGPLLTKTCASDLDCADVPSTCSNGWCVPAAPFPDGQQVVCGDVPPEDAEAYWTCGLDGPLYNPNEQPHITWYMTAGALTDVTSANTNLGDDDLASRTFAGFTRPAGPFTLYGVVRDGRDGEAWVAQAFQ